jgi:integrase/recombinase XerD
MARKGETKPRLQLGEPGDPEGLTALADAWIESLRVRNYSQGTVRAYDLYLGYFLEWCGSRALTRVSEITRPILQRYQHALFHYRKRSGQPLSTESQSERVATLKLFFRWLARENLIVSNPAADLDVPRGTKRLPKHVLTANEADRILSQPDVTTPNGIRDRAILEVLYSTGIRRLELIHLSVFDIDRERGLVLVRQGKGKKDRYVPIGERAISWTDKYLADVRPSLVGQADDTTLFLSHFGAGFTPDFLSRLVAGYIESAAIGKTGSCHLFRHTAATLMLEGGADIRFVQQMLGHANLNTTAIYTNVAIRKLKEIHAATHPSAKLERSVVIDLDDDDSE